MLILTKHSCLVLTFKSIPFKLDFFSLVGAGRGGSVRLGKFSLMAARGGEAATQIPGQAWKDLNHFERKIQARL